MQKNNIDEFSSQIINVDDLLSEEEYKESVYTKYIREKQEDFQQMNFHNKMITQIKNRLGTKCSYLSWVRHNDDYSIKAVIGGNKVTVALGGAPIDVDNVGYEDLFQKLNGHDEDK